MLTQRQWRLWGGISLALASAMALCAVLSDILHNSVMLLVALSSEKVAEAAQPIARWPLVLFWSAFALLILFALCFAAVDIRYIRLQYAEERRAIVQRTLHDSSFRETLRERTRPDRGEKKGNNGRA